MATPASAGQSRARWIVPSLADVIFSALLLMLLLFTIRADGSLGLLLDSNTGYHIRTGDYILQHRAVPHQDIFSFSQPGQPWFAWEWLSAVLFALLYQWAGMKGLMVFTGAVIALANLVLLRHMVWRGANVLVTLAILHLGIGASSIHYLARPHVFTLLFLAAALWLIDADRRRRSPRIWLLIPLAALWANLHGGFIALLVCLAIVAVGSALERCWTLAGRYALLGAACFAASGANPYGFAVHLHVIPYLRTKWITQLVQEFQSPTFHSAEGTYFELLLLAGIALAAWLLARKQFAEALLILAWAHASLTSVRHIPIYAIVVLPPLARQTTLLWDRWTAGAPRGSLFKILGAVAREHTPAMGRNSIWAPAAVVILSLFNLGWTWPTDFPGARFPAAVVGRNTDLIAGSRIFTTDSWADYLTFHNYPRQKIFVDGRSDFFGENISMEYLQILKGHYGWEALMNRYAFDAVLVPTESALASLLRLKSNWQVVDADGQAVLFRLAR